MDDRSFFDKIAPDWDANEILSTPEKINQILDYFDLNSGDSILDLGTGTGVLLPYLAERIGTTGNITAVDFSKEMLKIAKAKYESIHPTPIFLNLDIENETIPGEYDKIILYCVYPHFHTPLETLKWLQKVNLKPKGQIFIAFPCSADFINNIHKERHSDSDVLISPEELAEFLCKNDFNATSIGLAENDYVVRISQP